MVWPILAAAIPALTSLFGGAAAGGTAAAAGGAANLGMGTAMQSAMGSGMGNLSNILGQQGTGSGMGNLSNILGQQGTGRGFAGMGPDSIPGLSSMMGGGGDDGMLDEELTGESPPKNRVDMNPQAALNSKDMSDFSSLKSLFGMMNQIKRESTPRGRMDGITGDNPYIKSLMGG